MQCLVSAPCPGPGFAQGHQPHPVPCTLWAWALHSEYVPSGLLRTLHSHSIQVVDFRNSLSQMGQMSARPMGWSSNSYNFCYGSHHPGRTSRRPARSSTTGAAKEDWCPSCLASNGSTGPASRVPSRTGPTLCLRLGSSNCAAQARGVSLPAGEGSLGRGRCSSQRGRQAGVRQPGSSWATCSSRAREG